MPRFINTLCTLVPQRFVVYALTSLAVIVCYHQRFAYYLSLKQMTYQTPRVTRNSSSSCPFMIPNEVLLGQHIPRAEYYWNPSLKQTITQSFYIGYIIASIPSGMGADFFGARGMLGVGLLGSSIIAAVNPFLAGKGPYFLMTGRFFQGVFQTSIWSSSSVLAAQWAPSTERTTFVSMIGASGLGGIVIGHVMTHSARPERESWRTNFYVSGALGVLVSVAWFLLIHSEPARCPYMTDAERDLILSQTEAYQRKEVAMCPSVPWKQMFQSAPFCSLLLFSFGFGWQHFLLITFIITYLTYVVHLTDSLTNHAMILAVVAGVFSSLYWGVISDWLINHKVMSRTLNRTLIVFIGNILVVPLLFVTLKVGCNGLLVTVLFACMFYLRGMVFGILHANNIDLCPQYAGITSGIINCIIIFGALFSKELFIFICDEPSKIDKWYIVYVVNACIVVFCSLPILWLGSGETQQWNYARITRPSYNPPHS